MSNAEVESKVVEAFISDAKRTRYIQLLSSPKSRYKITRGLAHCRDFIKAKLEPIRAGEQTQAGILRLLLAAGAPQNCYVISENQDIDGKEMALTEALENVVGAGLGTLISCSHGHLAYYEGEGPNHRFLIHDKPI